MPPSPPSTTYPQPCPFCAIALANPPSSLLSPTSPPSNNPPSPSPPAHLILSTPHLLAFLDHAPISRGHVLLVVRAHREKLSDVLVREGESVGRWLAVVSRAVMGAVREKEEGGEGKGDGDADVGDWNVVQNNGARAAQVVPHVHFHIIPRVGDVPSVQARSWTVFGKGQREERGLGGCLGMGVGRGGGVSCRDGWGRVSCGYGCRCWIICWGGFWPRTCGGEGVGRWIRILVGICRLFSATVSLSLRDGVE
ncbi:HIT-like domain-containing protein [Usnea florida]